MMPNRSGVLALVCALAWPLGGGAQPVHDLGFTTRVSTALVAQFVRTFGDAAAGLLARRADFAARQKAAQFMQRLAASKGREAEVLQAVNDHLNGVPYVSDFAHWGRDDYWSTPAELVASNGGDCEDYAIAKYYLLKEFGVPIDRLRITYVRATRINEPHMVLAYYSGAGDEPLILDNIESRIFAASQRPDLVPVYSFNDDEVELVRDSRKGKSSQIRTWLSLQERLVAEANT